MFKLLLLLLLMLPTVAFARPSASATAVPTFGDDGDGRSFLLINVGSSSATDVYSMITTTPTFRIRYIEVKNPSETQHLFIGSSSTFVIENYSYSVDPASGTWGTMNRAPFWLKYAPGASSETVRILIEAE